MEDCISLWGDLTDILTDEKKQSKSITKKVDTKKVVSTDISKVIKSKKISVEERLKLINSEVDRVLGHYREDTLVIKSRKELHDYITKAIDNKIIAIDTETNNSLDYITCKLMGLCIYTPTEKQAYVPVNHTNLDGIRLDCQVTENDIKEELERLSNTFTIFHNGKFDYQVLKCTCHVPIHISWDTMIAAKLIDENEISAGLKQQYIEKIDKNQEKYSIDHLFENVEYAVVSPEVFALYSATDAYMTYKLYEYQLKIMNSDDYKNVKKLFFNVEMPCVIVVAEMELNGIEIDQEYAKKLGDKYHKKINELQDAIDKELLSLKPTIDKWRLTSEANKKEIKNGKESKSKAEQLEDPVNLDSPSQLSIMLYDILKSPVIDKKSPRGTGGDILEKMDFPICKLICKRKEILKLSKDFIDSLPTKVNIDNRIHCSFNQYGARTGRFSSTNPNLQQVPSHSKDIRMMFKASTKEHIVESESNIFEVPYTDEVETSKGYVLVKNLKIGDKLIIDNKEEELKNISYKNNIYELYI